MRRDGNALDIDQNVENRSGRSASQICPVVAEVSEMALRFIDSCGVWVTDLMITRFKY